MATFYRRNDRTRFVSAFVKWRGYLKTRDLSIFLWDSIRQYQLKVYTSVTNLVTEELLDWASTIRPVLCTIIGWYWRRFLRGIDALRFAKALKDLDSPARPRTDSNPFKKKKKKKKQSVAERALPPVPEEEENEKEKEREEEKEQTPSLPPMPTPTPTPPRVAALRDVTLQEPPRTSSDYESTIGGQTTCVVCFDGAKTHAAVPCGHISVCVNCVGSNQLKTCPCCRAPVQLWLFTRVV
jgi:hypothetical protein